MDSFDISVQRFNDFANEYAERFKNIDAYIDSFERFYALNTINSPTILELACGPGNVTGYLKSRLPKSKILGIDLAPKMIELAHQSVPNADFKVMDVRNISDMKQNYDMIMCAFCLPFLSKADTNILIADCALLLNPQGKLFISTMEGSELDVGFETTSFSGEASVYFNYHKQTDLEHALKTNGFKVEYFKRQAYTEVNGSITYDLIFIAEKEASSL